MQGESGSRHARPALGCQKNTLIDKKCADCSMSRRRQRHALWARRRPAARREISFLDGTLTIWLLRPYKKRRHLEALGLPGSIQDECHGARRGTERGTVSMTVELNENAPWLILVGLAICFMLWVLWNWWKEERRRGNSFARLTSPDRPTPSIAFRDGRRTGIAARR